MSQYLLYLVNCIEFLNLEHNRMILLELIVFSDIGYNELLEVSKLIVSLYDPRINAKRL